MKRKLRVLVLVDNNLIPPANIKDFNLDKVPWRTEHYVISTLKSIGHKVEVLGVESDLRVIRRAREEFKPHIAFNLLEQFDGEAVFDHNVVSYLELIGLSYSGCNPKGLLLGRDKALSKKILYYHRIRTPLFAVVKRGKKFKRPKSLEFPLIVKPLNSEGSIGIAQSSIVPDEAKLNERVNFIHESIQKDAIIESFIEGKDLYVSILGNNKLSVFPFVELVFKNAPDNIHRIATSRVKWDPSYRQKYKIDIKISRLSDELTTKIVHLSKRIYRILGMNGYARLDLRLTDSGTVYFLEANPNPDIARGDEFAYSAHKANITYPNLLNRILSLGLN